MNPRLESMAVCIAALLRIAMSFRPRPDRRCAQNWKRHWQRHEGTAGRATEATSGLTWSAPFQMGSSRFSGPSTSLWLRRRQRFRWGRSGPRRRCRLLRAQLGDRAGDLQLAAGQSVHTLLQAGEHGWYLLELL
jgi:hypothetical protein